MTSLKRETNEKQRRRRDLSQATQKPLKDDIGVIERR
jgi:hypothetical protein